MIIQKFGIEIRKIGQVGELYKEVDKVLEKSGDRIKLLAIAHGIQKMLRPDQWIDVCFIKEAAELAHIIIPRERMITYHSIHCMHWNEMTEEFRMLVMAMVLDDFRSILCPNEAKETEYEQDQN